MKHLKSFNESIDDDYKFFGELIHTINDICAEMIDNGWKIKNLYGIIQIDNDGFPLPFDENVKESLIRVGDYLNSLDKTSFRYISIGTTDVRNNILKFNSIEDVENYIVGERMIRLINWIMIKYDVNNIIW